uniref:Uncharacterized protein n=1 Tax=Arundo donax TaxID=35708 RepID=A0A0A8ZYX6_ARUDO
MTHILQQGIRDP